MSKQERGYFTLSNEELASTEMVLTAFTMLESRGYPGFTELMAILNDPTIILKIIRFLYGMKIEVPPLQEFIKCLKAAQYVFCDMHKKIHVNLPAKPADIRKSLNISEEEEKELLEIFDHWTKYMHDQGHDIRNYFHMNRQNTKKRIAMTVKGKKWTSKNY